MKKYFFRHKILLVFLFLNVLILISSYVFFKTDCFSNDCSYYLREGIIHPSFWLGVMFTPLLFFFLFFPEIIFKLWLKRIAWWYGIMTFIFVASTSIYSSHIMSMSRAQVIIWCVSILAILTVPFVFVVKKRLKISNDN